MVWNEKVVSRILYFTYEKKSVVNVNVPLETYRLIISLAVEHTKEYLNGDVQAMRT